VLYFRLPDATVVVVGGSGNHQPQIIELVVKSTELQIGLVGHEASHCDWNQRSGFWHNRQNAMYIKELPSNHHQ
jgi:hypothetical protein